MKQDIAEALKAVADAMKQKEEEQKERAKNINEFYSKLGALAKEHKVFFQGLFLDANVWGSRGNFHEVHENVVDFGFEDQHEFAHRLSDMLQEGASSFAAICALSGGILERHCNAEEYSEQTEPVWEEVHIPSNDSD